MSYLSLQTPLRHLPSLLSACAAAALMLTAAPAAAQPATTQGTESAAQGDNWLYAGSDIPRDAGWKFGELPNGVRYAVRNNGVPPGQVSIRVRMDVGSMFETEQERGFAHLLEHLTFRGSNIFPMAKPSASGSGSA